MAGVVLTRIKLVSRVGTRLREGENSTAEVVPKKEKGVNRSGEVQDQRMV